MRATTVTVSSQTTSASLPVDRRASPVIIALACVISGGAVLTYKVQYTYDNIFDTTITPTWFDHATITGKSANFDGSLTIPITAVRLNVTAFTSGSVTLTVQQSPTS